MTGVFPHTDLLCGVRILDKSKVGLEGSYRIEVWTKIVDQVREMKEIREYLIGQFAQVVYENGDSEILKFRELSQREKWVDFKCHSP